MGSIWTKCIRDSDIENQIPFDLESTMNYQDKIPDDQQVDKCFSANLTDAQFADLQAVLRNRDPTIHVQRQNQHSNTFIVTLSYASMKRNYNHILQAFKDKDLKAQDAVSQVF